MKETGRNKGKRLRYVDGVLKKQHKDDLHGLNELLVIGERDTLSCSSMENAIRIYIHIYIDT